MHALHIHTAAKAHKFSRISSMSAMLRRDPSTHNPSPSCASHHPTSPAHLSSNLQPDPEKPHVIIILSVVAEEFILKLNFFQELISNFQQPLSYMPAQTKTNAGTKKKRKTVPENLIQKGVHKRQPHSECNNMITHASLLQIIIRMSFQKQQFRPFFYQLFFLFLPPPVLHAPPCFSTKPIKGSWVLVRSLEQARGGGQTRRPLR